MSKQTRPQNDRGDKQTSRDLAGVPDAAADKQFAAPDAPAGSQNSAKHSAGENASPQHAAAQRDTEWRRPYQDSPGADTLAQTPEPVTPEPPNKVPIDPPNEPPSPNPVHVPPAPVRPGDLPASNPDVLSHRSAQRAVADDKGLIARRPSVH